MYKAIILLFLLCPLAVFGQERLNKLVSERQQLHEQWQQSENQKSGIFGNRTKKDMIATNEWMARIIEKDRSEERRVGKGGGKGWGRRARKRTSSRPEWDTDRRGS